MTPDRIAELRALMEKATPGPWKLVRLNVHAVIKDARGNYVMEPVSRRGCVRREPDAALIVAAVNALLDLLAAIEARDAEIARLRGALGHIAMESDEDCRNRDDADALVSIARNAISNAAHGRASADIAAARRAALREAAAVLDKAAADLIGDKKRVNMVDRHTADILRTKAAEIFDLRELGERE